MSFIDKVNRFATNPVKMDMKRSKFNLSHGSKFTMNAGKLVPVMVDEVLPDDTIKIDVSSVVRMIPAAVPVMDNAYLDIFAFWCPARILTAHSKDWEKIHGENTSGFWAPSSESSLQNTGNTFIHNFNDTTYATPEQSLAAYIGIPVGYYNNSNIAISRLPFNGYTEIWNNWFRDENTQAPVSWKTWSDANYVDKYFRQNSCLDVNKFHDYFTSALPGPQKGASVLLPMAGSAPVVTGAINTNITASSNNSVRFATGGTVSAINWYNLGMLKSNSDSPYLMYDPAVSASGHASDYAVPNNLYADLTNATASSVNDLRQAFAIQKLLEKDARGGTRYKEVLLAHFGVAIPDNTIQIPEYLGGKRIPLNMLQVLQTTPTSSSPLGTTGAFSNTADNSYLFTKSFSEHGYIYILCCIRNNQGYSQGLSRMFTRNRRYDFYYPVFANLGEQAVKKIELFADGSSNLTDIFGYQECWAEYRFKPTKISGFMSANSSDATAKLWTYGNQFAAAPTLNSSFMVQDKSQIGNTLVVTNSSYQFICDFFINYTAWRAMPYFSIPGLIDHH